MKMLSTAELSKRLKVNRSTLKVRLVDLKIKARQVIQAGRVVNLYSAQAVHTVRKDLAKRPVLPVGRPRKK